MTDQIVSDLGFGDYPYAVGPLAFDPTTSSLAGLSPDVLRAQLGILQLALFQLAAGKIVEVSYAQGDGTKTVKYASGNIGAINAMIQLIQSQLGAPRVRRPISMVYR